jgi:hypothetical protein
MKTTEIHIWGFANEFMVEVKRKKYLTMEEAQAWTLKNTVDTATVIKIVHKYPNDSELAIHNENYKPFEPDTMNIDHLKKSNKNETT